MKPEDVKILVIEDSAVIVEFMFMHLKSKGFDGVKVCKLRQAEWMLGFGLLSLIPQLTKVILMSTYLSRVFDPLEKYPRLDAFIWKIQYHEKLVPEIGQLLG